MGDPDTRKIWLCSFSALTHAPHPSRHSSRTPERLRYNAEIVPRIPEGSLPLAIYTFFGLIPLDPSWSRTASAFVASALFLFWCLREEIRVPDDREGWRWNKGASRSLTAMAILSSSAILPFLERWLRQRPDPQQAVQDAAELVAYLIFSFSVAVVIYILRFLDPPPARDDTPLDIESLRLEHQTCISIFQTGATCMVVMFLGALLSPIMGAKAGTADVTITMLGWAFYWFAGFIVWFLRPCLDRAKSIRRQLEHRRTPSGRVTSA